MEISTKPNAPTQTLDTTVTIRDTLEMGRLMADLRATIAKSKRNGGVYSVTCQDGKKRIVFMIHLS